MNQQIAVREEVSPEQFDQNIEAAQHKARSLKAIVDSQGLSVRIGPSEHLKVEAWLTIAAGYGFSPRIAWSRPLPEGGYEAHAELVDSLGTVVGAGEAECGTAGDDNWLTKPAFQQRSMAQTRATVRACRNKLAWVVILAGYNPTPAEEMLAEERKPALKDNRYWCAEHQTEWFKKGKMKNYAHPSAQQGGPWCYMKDARLDAGDYVDVPSEPPAPVEPSAEAPEGPSVEASTLPASVGELLTRAIAELGYKDRTEVFSVLGIKSATEIAYPGKLAPAWRKLEELAKKL